MKKMTRVFGLLLILGVIFTSCGSDDDNRREYQFEGTCKETISLKGFESQDTSTDKNHKVSLNDLLKKYDYVPPVIKGELYLTDGTSIRITGLENGVILKNFVLSINDLKYNFGDINADKSNLYTNVTLEYFRNSFNRMIGNKKLRVYATFTPNEKIDVENNVNLEIVFKGMFTYKK